MVYGVLEIEIMNAVWQLQEQNEDVNRERIKRTLRFYL